MAELEIRRRNLPHWTIRGAWYYVTFRMQGGAMTPTEQCLVLEHIKSGHSRFYRLIAACVMPDHVHVILRPNDDISLSRIMQGIKGATARYINRLWGVNGPFRQLESWDRILRSEAELQQKVRYMLMNPTEEGLVDDPWTYPGWYLQE